MSDQTLTLILAGGEGSRLQPLTRDRAKPAVPFGGRYRIIDFVLSNCLHSGMRRILVLTQYKSHSLHKHLRDGWSIFNPQLGEYVTAVPPQMRVDDAWYQGTANAVYQNWYLAERSGARYVLVLAGDHIYRMDYAAMLAEHHESGSDLTVACMPAPLSEASRFGVARTDAAGRIESFQEKPANPAPMPDRRDEALVSMGIYVFSLDALREVLHEDHDNPNSSHDFGADIIPMMLDRGAVNSYRFGGTSGRVSRDRYWRDVGTIDGYFGATMDLLQPIPPLDLYQPGWEIRSDAPQHPPARTTSGISGNEGICVNSLVANGVMISGACVSRSVLFPTVKVDDGAVVENSILFEGTHVGPGADLRNCIVDKDVRIPAGFEVGVNQQSDRERFHVSEDGVVVIPKSYQFGS